MKKVICILDSIHIYGKERANINVYNVLIKNGYNICVMRNIKASPSMINNLNHFRHIPIHFPRGVSNIFKKIINIVKSNLSINKYIKKEKITHILIPTEIALLYLYPVLIRNKCKVIFRMGDDPISFRFKNNILIGIYRIIWKLILRRINIVVCNAKYIQDNLIKSGRILNQKDRIIYNLMPIRVNRNHISTILENKQSSSLLTIGYIGRLVPEKGVHILIKVINTLIDEGHNIQLHIAGSLTFNKEYSNSLLELVDINKKDRICFLGELQEIDTFYNRIDLLCLPSIYPEPSANVVVEAKSFKKGTILFNIGGTIELIQHLTDGYICQDITEIALKEALVFYLNDTNKIKEHGIAAYESINKLGIDSISFEKNWLKVFETSKL